jgi:hypothetical protein
MKYLLEVEQKSESELTIELFESLREECNEVSLGEDEMSERYLKAFEKILTNIMSQGLL